MTLLNPPRTITLPIPSLNRPRQVSILQQHQLLPVSNVRNALPLATRRKSKYPKVNTNRPLHLNQLSEQIYSPPPPRQSLQRHPAMNLCRQLDRPLIDRLTPLFYMDLAHRDRLLRNLTGFRRAVSRTLGLWRMYVRNRERRKSLFVRCVWTALRKI